VRMRFAISAPMWCGATRGMSDRTRPITSHLIGVAFAVLSLSLVVGSEVVAQNAESADTAADLASRITLQPGGLIQMRYTLNRREPPAEENEWIQGFQLTRVRIALRADFEDRARLFVRAGNDAGGQFKFERAYADLYFGSTTLRFGQFYVPGDAELDPSPQNTLAADYSPTGYTFDVGASQGGMAVFRPGSWRISTMLHAGLRAGFSQSGAETRADIAATAYVEHLFVGDGWSGFGGFSSPRGSAPALKVGLGSTYQTGGETGNTDTLDLLWASADIRAVGSGWNALGQFTFVRTEPGEGPDAGQTFDDMGFIAQGGVFATRHVEVFLRYDQVIPDGKERSADFGGTGTNDFRTVTGGFNIFLIPGSTLGKFTVDYQYMFDAQTTSIVPTALNAGVFSSTGPQWTLRAQWVTAF